MDPARQNEPHLEEVPHFIGALWEAYVTAGIVSDGRSLTTDRKTVDAFLLQLATEDPLPDWQETVGTVLRPLLAQTADQTDIYDGMLASGHWRRRSRPSSPPPLPAPARRFSSSVRREQIGIAVAAFALVSALISLFVVARWHEDPAVVIDDTIVADVLPSTERRENLGGQAEDANIQSERSSERSSVVSAHEIPHAERILGEVLLVFHDFELALLAAEQQRSAAAERQQALSDAEPIPDGPAPARSEPQGFLGSIFGRREECSADPDSFECFCESAPSHRVCENDLHFADLTDEDRYWVCTHFPDYRWCTDFSFDQSASPASTSNIQNIRFGSDGERTRIVIEITQPVEFRAFTVGGIAHRLVVDLPRTEWNVAGLEGGEGMGHELVEEFRFFNNSSDSSRLVFDLGEAANVAAQFTLAPTPPSTNHRIVIDIEPGSTNDALNGATFPGLDSLIAERVEASYVPPPRERPVIVIDAGHGGRDPGATGVRGTVEKDITLAAARTLQESLNATGQFQAILTRDMDQFQTLAERVSLLSLEQGDLFISLHADSATDSDTSGAAVYTLNDRAEDRARGRARASSSELQQDVSSILVALTLRERRNASNRFADVLVSELASVGPMRNNPDGTSAIYVLVDPSVPAVLLEMGSLSSPEDEARLIDPEFRTEQMSAVLRAINTFFDRRPAPDLAPTISSDLPENIPAGYGTIAHLAAALAANDPAGHPVEAYLATMLAVKPRHQFRRFDVTSSTIGDDLLLYASAAARLRGVPDAGARYGSAVDLERDESVTLGAQLLSNMPELRPVLSSAAAQSESALPYWEVVMVEDHASWAHLSLGLAPAIATLAFGLLLSRSRFRAYLRRRRLERRDRQIALEVEATAEAARARYASRKASTALNKRADSGRSALDIPLSIAATIENSGFLTRRYRPLMETPLYLVLIDRRSRNDVEFARVRDLLSRLIEEGVDIHILSFFGDAQHVFEELPTGERGPSRSLSYLQEHSPNARLIVWSTGQEIVEPLSLKPRDWARQLKHWQQRALATPLPRSAWAQREAELLKSVGLKLAQSSLGEIETLASLFDVDNIATDASADDMATTRRLPDFVRRSDVRLSSEVPAAPEHWATVERQLRAYLGADGFDWLSAIAAYPEISWIVVRHIGLQLPARRGGASTADSTVFSEATLERLAVLPWFRLGFMPEWVRRKLLATLDRQRARMVRRVVAELIAGGAPSESSLAQPRRLNMWWTDLSNQRGTSFELDAVTIEFLGKGGGDDIDPIVKSDWLNRLRPQRFNWFVGPSVALLIAALAWAVTGLALVPSLATPLTPGYWIPIAGFTAAAIVSAVLLDRWSKA